MTDYLNYWGKARPQEGAATQWHPLAYHSLDVAAVGIALLERQATLHRRLAHISGLNEAAVLRWMFLSLALHDLGKFAPAFQAKVPELFTAQFGRDAWRPTSLGHDQDGLVLWKKRYRMREETLALFCAPGAGRSHQQRAPIDGWVAAAICHHGKPRDGSGLLDDRFTAKNCAAIDSFVADVTRIAETMGLAATKPPPLQIEASWLVSGLAVLCDWIGSGQHWFPYHPPDVAADLSVYWREHAKPRAARAIIEAGVIAASPAVSVCLPHLLPADAQPSPLQGAAATMAIGFGPRLFIVEDQTGAGKTEAALALAGRLIRAGQGDGLYVAMPTMATANAMYERCATLYAQLFAKHGKPSITLAHSRRDLVHALRTIELGRAEADPADEVDYRDGLETASVACTRWLGDDRRKAALADCGIGTVDQAVLAVLPSRFQSLRLAGLARKVLIVDEVHAHDAYLRNLVCGLLRFHAALGGSAILLSATLPAGQTREYVAAFADGLCVPRPVAPPDHAYPMVTRFGRGGVETQAVDPRPGLARDLPVEFLADAEAAGDVVVAAAQSGHAVCWIRNTVADAMVAYAALRERIGPDKLILFHARFAIGDRLAIEQRVLALFGKDSSAEARRGWVLVATQVVEQSLDLDFDVLVSDLAPIDALIQRAGRLWRHARAGRRGAPVLHVLSPDPAGPVDASWYRRMFPRAAKVYSDHGALWLTADELARRGTLHLPADARALIEAVYGDEAASRIPEALEANALAAIGDGLSRKRIAETSLLPLENGYPGALGQFEEEARVPTRLGQPQSQLRLARWQDGILRPWAEGEDWFAWRLSELTVLKIYVAEEAPATASLAAAIQTVRSGWAEHYRDSVVIALTPEGDGSEAWVGQALNPDKKPMALRYSARFGLAISRAAP